MSLAGEYARQRAWRSWATVLDALPSVAGRAVLDLGCAIGDQAAELVARGARVIAVDANEELLGVARARGLANAEFRSADLSALEDLGVRVDGLWCSFAAAYFPDLWAPLASWAKHLRAGGWVALTEVDDLFGHEPLGARTRSLLAGYARDALRAGRYDFHMGRKLAGHLERAGFTLERELSVADRELSFDGPAGEDVLDSWRGRLARMRLSRDFCGADFDLVRDELLACLAHPEHRCTASVRCAIASR